MLANLIVILSSFLISNHNGPEYTVEKTVGKLEIRNYEPWIVAETVVKTTHEDAANEAFHILAGYIFGNNDQKVKIEMTAPVTQQQIGEGEYLVQFFMPKGWTLNSLPKPNDSRVNLRMVPERKLAALRYNGGWSEGSYNQEVLKAEVDLGRLGIERKGEPIWARYNSPMAPTFLRTNEIVFEI